MSGAVEAGTAAAERADEVVAIVGYIDRLRGDLREWIAAGRASAVEVDLLDNRLRALRGGVISGVHRTDGDPAIPRIVRARLAAEGGA